MDDQQRRVELAQRLSEAGAAHGQYEMTALHGEYDQQWAEWYARFLLDHGWNDLWARLDSPARVWTVSELSDALRHADTDQRATAPQQRWQDFYAERLVV